MGGQLISAKTGKLIGDPPPAPTAEEILEQERAQAQANRLAAYRSEADPLFFKWQAGEGTKTEWKAKRAEIRERYPMPE